MNNFSEETRKIYHEQHNKVANDEIAMNRFINMFTYEYFGVDKDFFKDKKVLDAGCGNTGKVIIAMNKLGAKSIDAFDLGSDFIPYVKQSIKHYGVPEEKVHITSGNLLNIPYPDESFDFVICHGVLTVLNTLDEVEKAFSELVRVTKKNGYLYTVYGVVGGLIEDAIFPAIRKYYRENEDFKHFIDTGTPEVYAQIIKFIETESAKYEKEKFDLSFMNKFFDVDFCVFLQNVIQPPVRLEISEEFIKTMYQKNQFTNLRRLHRYVKRENIRKFMSPLHYNTDYTISKILYGSGNLEFIAQKL